MADVGQSVHRRVRYYVLEEPDVSILLTFDEMVFVRLSAVVPYLMITPFFSLVFCQKDK